DVPDLECAGVDVAHDQVGRGGSADGSNARELPLQGDRSQRAPNRRDRVVDDVVKLQFTGIGVAQQEIAFAGVAAEVANARELPLRADSPRAPRWRSPDKHVVVDVVNLEFTGVDVAHHEIGFAGDRAAEVADARELPRQADRAYGGRASDQVVADVVNKHSTLDLGKRIGVARYHVGVAGDAAEGAESQGLPIQPHRADHGRTCDGVAHNVIHLECPVGGAGAQQNVAGIAIVETADSDKISIASQSAQRAAGQQRIISEGVDCIGTVIGSYSPTQHHDGAGGGRRGRIVDRTTKAESIHDLDVHGRELAEHVGKYSCRVEWIEAAGPLIKAIGRVGKVGGAIKAPIH